MKLLERALSKLNIKAYQDREGLNAIGAMQAMYNPDSITLNYGAEFSTDSFINSDQQSNRYQRLRQGALNLQLVFDASLPGNKTPVDEQVSRLRALCGEVLPKTSEPPFLRVEWGKMDWNGHGYFAGRMTSLSVRYTLFARDGAPLRAEVALELSADESLQLQKSKQGLNTPTKSRVVVPDSSSLALVAGTVAAGVGIAGLTVDYLSLAFANDLNSLDDIVPGDALVVPDESEARS